MHYHLQKESFPKKFLKTFKIPECFLFRLICREREGVVNP